MIEPGPTGDYGACGIGRAGMDATYSAALWRDNPTAFWLHPEGPLADSTPGEFFTEPEPMHSIGAQMAGLGLYGSYRHAQMQNVYQNSLFSGPEYAAQYAQALQHANYLDYANAMQNANRRY